MASVTHTALPKVKLIATDGVPLESPWHWAGIVLLIDSLRFHLRGRSNYFVGGNMFLYYSEEQARNRDYRGADFFFVDGVDGLKPREWWAVWEEDDRYPDVIMELLSPTTAKLDRTVKKRRPGRSATRSLEGSVGQVGGSQAECRRRKLTHDLSVTPTPSASMITSTS